MQFTISRKDFTCAMQYSNGRSVEITMQDPTLEDNDMMCSEHVKIKYFDSQGEVVDEFVDVTSDEFGGMLKELQYIPIVPRFIEEAQAMDEAMYVGEPPVLTQADLQGGSDESVG